MKDMKSETTGTVRVLHVDDEPDFADLAATFLEREDSRFTVETATSASDGLERLADTAFDCIISDYDMPGQNGIEFLKTIREDYPDLPFILYTGKGSEEVASDAISAGVTDYLQKEGGTDQYTLLANRVQNAIERYRSEQAHQRYLKAFETAQEGISILNDAGEFIYVNDAYANLYGYDFEEMVGEYWELIYPDDDAERVREEILPTVTDEGYWHGETTGLRADGTTFPEDHVLAQSETGELICTVRDLSDQRERASELRMKNRAMDEAPVGITISDPAQDDNPLIYVNDYFTELTGYPDEEAVGSNCRYLQGENTDPERVAQMREAIDAEEPVTVELRNYRKDGTEFWDWVSIAPIRTEDGEVTNWVGFQQDITDTKEREQRLTALNDVSQALMTAESRDEVAEIGVEAARDVLGLEANAIHLYEEGSGLIPVGHTAAATELVGDLPTFTGDDSIAWRVYEQREPLALDDLHDDPDIYNPETALQSELYLPLGKHGIMIAASDTAKAFDQQDTVFGEILASSIVEALNNVERTERLRTHEQELIQQNDSLEEFTSIVSHDLRNPLNVAEGRLEFAQDECDSEHLADVDRALERMSVLIDDLLTLAREGEQVSELEPVDLVTLTENCWQTVATGDATLTTDIDQRIHADRSRLQQLLENLLRNAVEHGGDDVTITVGELDDGFYVEDNGPGISEDNRDEVFDAGYSTTEGGTGFGLSIVNQIANAHGWDVHVTDSPEDGARFEITGVQLTAE